MAGVHADPVVDDKQLDWQRLFISGEEVDRDTRCARLQRVVDELGNRICRTSIPGIAGREQEVSRCRPTVVCSPPPRERPWRPRGGDSRLRVIDSFEDATGAEDLDLFATVIRAGRGGSLSATAGEDRAGRERVSE